MNIDNIKVTNNFKNDIINHKEFCRIQIDKYMEGNIGYVTFLNNNALVANIENDKYNKNGKIVKLPTFYDINSFYVSNLFSDHCSPYMGKMLVKSLTRVAHNLCIFENKDRTGFYGIGGRFDKRQPDRWKPFGITEDKGLYLLQKNKLDGTSWKLMNESKPIIGKDPLSKYHKPASYDSQISCIYSQMLQKYVLIVRNNVGKEQRYFSVLHSNDCISWSDFKIPTLTPPYEPESGDQYYSIILHEILHLKIILASALFYNEKTKLYGIKLLITHDTKNWKDAGIIFTLPIAKMPRNAYIRPKIHCGGITSDKYGRITFFFYKYKERNNIEYFKKTYLFSNLFDAI